MKKIGMLEIAVILVGLLFLASTARGFSQTAHIVHYDTNPNGKIEGKRPDFKGTVVAIDFGGGAAITAKNLFLKLGVKDFSEGKNPCAVDQSVICVRVRVEPSVEMSSYGSSYGSSNSGGTYNSGSFSGKLYPVDVTIDLIDYLKDGTKNTVPLGAASCVAPSGSSYESISSYGSHGGGSFSAGETSGLDATIGNAVSKDITRLLDPSGLKRLLAMSGGSYSKWLPGADLAVTRAFAKTDAVQ